MENETQDFSRSFFEHTPSIAKLAEALAVAQGKIETASKDKFNPHFKSRYADLASIWDACRVPLSSSGLAIVQFVSADDARVIVTTMLMHSSGEWLRSTLSLMARDGTPQNLGSAITYGKRYGLAAMVGIAPDDDDDGNASSAGAPGRPGYEFQTPPAQDDPRLEAAIGDWKDVIADACDEKALSKIGQQLGREPDPVKLAVRDAYAQKKRELDEAAKKGKA